MLHPCDEFVNAFFFSMRTFIIIYKFCSSFLVNYNISCLEPGPYSLLSLEDEDYFVRQFEEIFWCEKDFEEMF